MVLLLLKQLGLRVLEFRGQAAVRVKGHPASARHRRGVWQSAFAWSAAKAKRKKRAGLMNLPYLTPQMSGLHKNTSIRGNGESGWQSMRRPRGKWCCMAVPSLSWGLVRFTLQTWIGLGHSAPPLRSPQYTKRPIVRRQPEA